VFVLWALWAFLSLSPQPSPARQQKALRGVLAVFEQFSDLVQQFSVVFGSFSAVFGSFSAVFRSFLAAFGSCSAVFSRFLLFFSSFRLFFSSFRQFSSSFRFFSTVFGRFRRPSAPKRRQASSDQAASRPSRPSGFQRRRAAFLADFLISCPANDAIGLWHYRWQNLAGAGPEAANSEKARNIGQDAGDPHRGVAGHLRVLPASIDLRSERRRPSQPPKLRPSGASSRLRQQEDHHGPRIKQQDRGQDGGAGGPRAHASLINQSMNRSIN